MERYFANFIKTGNPNGGSEPKWPAANAGGQAHYIQIDVDTHEQISKHEGRFTTLDKIPAQ